jgi:dethiobiotin synthetase
MRPLFITGIGTNIGKTVVAAIVTEALKAVYWKPVQAGLEEVTDTQWVRERISNPEGRLLPETYRLAMPASPHIAARQEGVIISLDKIVEQFDRVRSGGPSVPQSVPVPASSGSEASFLVIEGAGGLFVPLNETRFVLDLVQRLDATVILVSRNYLGSINHSLLTAATCRANGLRVAGWIFNDQYGQYEQEIAQWTGLPAIASIPFQEGPDMEFIRLQADRIRFSLQTALERPLPSGPPVSTGKFGVPLP